VIPIAWTTPRTWTAGETVTAAELNTHIRDNENYLFGPTSWQARQITTGTSLPDSAWTAVVLNTTDVDTDSLGFSAGGVLIATAGTYLVCGNCSIVIAGAAGTRRGAAVMKNGTIINGSQNLAGSSGTQSLQVPTGTVLVVCAVNDVLKLAGFQDTGAAVLTNVVATVQSTLTVLRRL